MINFFLLILVQQPKKDITSWVVLPASKVINMTETEVNIFIGIFLVHDYHGWHKFVYPITDNEVVVKCQKEY